VVSSVRGTRCWVPSDFLYRTQGRHNEAESPLKRCRTIIEKALDTRKSCCPFAQQP